MAMDALFPKHFHEHSHHHFVFSVGTSGFLFSMSYKPSTFQSDFTGKKQLPSKVASHDEKIASQTSKVKPLQPVKDANAASKVSKAIHGAINERSPIFILFILQIFVQRCAQALCFTK